MKFNFSMRPLTLALASMACAVLVPGIVAGQAVADPPAEAVQEVEGTVEGAENAEAKSDDAKPAAQEGQLDTSREAALERITYDIKYLASDELGGRQPGTPGMKLAEDYIIGEYKKAGLKPCGDNGTYKQMLDVRGQRKLIKESMAMELVGPNDAKIKLTAGENARPLTSRVDIDADTELVFAGYGITSKVYNYDDYANADVKDRWVVIIRREPQQGDEDSVFEGTDTTRYASVRSKISGARRAGAAGIIMVNDGYTATDAEKDELVAADQFGSSSMPYIHLKRSVLDEMLAASPVVLADASNLSSVADIEKHIDETLEPITQPLVGWKLKATVKYTSGTIPTANLVGVIEGEGPRADETIVIGAHHDHLGMGQYGSRAGGRREIHNGADDNATGTAAVIELVRRIKASGKKPGRRLVFVCFTAEEMGLLGAAHYVANPIYPLEKTVAMLNYDMIGWLRDDPGLVLYDWNSSPQFGALLDETHKGFDFNLDKPRRGFGGSDHLPFRGKKIPVIFFHTGQTDVYHTPEDDFETIDCDGALTVIDYTHKFTLALANFDGDIKWATSDSGTTTNTSRFRLGVNIDAEDEEQVRIAGVADGSVAKKNGLQVGDVIVAIGEDEIKTRRDLSRILRRDAGKEVNIKLKREDTEMVLKVLLKNDE